MVLVVSFFTFTKTAYENIHWLYELGKDAWYVFVPEGDTILAKEIFDSIKCNSSSAKYKNLIMQTRFKETKIGKYTQIEAINSLFISIVSADEFNNIFRYRIISLSEKFRPNIFPQIMEMELGSGPFNSFAETDQNFEYLVDGGKYFAYVESTVPQSKQSLERRIFLMNLPVGVDYKPLPDAVNRFWDFPLKPETLAELRGTVWPNAYEIYCDHKANFEQKLPQIDSFDFYRDLRF